MKNITTSELKQAKKIAYSNFFSSMNLVLAKKLKLDRRYRVCKLALEIFKNIEAETNRQNIISKIRNRRENKFVFTNILQNKLVNDFRLHKSDVRFIHDNFIQFWNRNHHAKNEQDLKVIQVLKKHFTK